MNKTVRLVLLCVVQAGIVYLVMKGWFLFAAGIDANNIAHGRPHYDPHPILGVLLGAGAAWLITVWPFKFWHRRKHPEIYERKKQQALEDYYRYCAERGLKPKV